MKLRTALLAALLFAGSAHAQYVPPMPQPIIESVSPAPCYNCQWQPGYWAWDNVQWVWVSGRWITIQHVQQPPVIQWSIILPPVVIHRHAQQRYRYVLPHHGHPIRGRTHRHN